MLIPLLVISIKNMSCITLRIKEEALGTLKILTCKFLKSLLGLVQHWFWYVCLSLHHFSPPQSIFRDVWRCHKLVVLWDPPPCSNPSSLDPIRLSLLIQGVICHLPSQLTPKIQLRLDVCPTNQVLPQLIFIDLCKCQEVSMATFSPIKFQVFSI